MITPILHICNLNLKKQPNQNENLPKKKSVDSFKNILDKEIGKIANLKIDIYI